MPHRDPRTGQFVADAEDVHSAAYEDFDVQWLSNRVNIQTDHAAISDELVEGWARAEPLGGLQRDELAELVAVDVDVQVDPRGSGDSAGKVQMRGELSLDSVAHIADPDLGTADDDVDGHTGLDREAISVESDPDILDVYTVSGTENADTTNGVGLTRGEDYTAFVPLRRWFGQGPVLDRHSEVFLHIWVQVMSTGEPDIWQDVRLIWDVFDR